MALSQTFFDLVADFESADQAQRVLRQMRKDGLGSHLTVTFEPADPESQAEAQLAQMAANHIDAVLDRLGVLIDAKLQERVDKAETAVTRQLKVELRS